MRARPALTTEPPHPDDAPPFSRVGEGSGMRVGASRPGLNLGAHLAAAPSDCGTGRTSPWRPTRLAATPDPSPIRERGDAP